jgi:lipopolysaccharide export system permease protein
VSISTGAALRIITRYVLTQLLLTFIMTLLGMTMIMVLGIMAREGLRQGLGLRPIAKLLPYVLPGALRFSIPATMLLAGCSVFGRLAADQEIVALKALGIAPKQVLRPAWRLALAVSLVSVWLNEVAITWGTRGVERVIAESIESMVYRTLRTQRSYSTDRFSVHVKGVSGERLIRPTVVLRAGDGEPPVTLVAREARLRSNLEDRTLSILLTDGMVEAGDDAFYFPDTEERVIPLSAAARRNRRFLSPSEIGLGRIPSEVNRQRAANRRLEQRMAAQAACQLILGDFKTLADSGWHDRHENHEQGISRLRRLRLEPWRRFATGFGSFFFLFVGAPLAVLMRSANFFTTFASCFLPIMLVYYPLLTLGVDQAKQGALPGCASWLGNLALLVMGLWLIRRVHRY